MTGTTNAAHERRALLALPVQQVGCPQGNALRVRRLQHGIAVRRLRRLPIREHRDAAIPYPYGELLMRQQRRHAELRDARQQGLAARELYLARHLAAEFPGELRCDLVAHGIRDDDEKPAAGRCDPLRIKRCLLRHLADLAIPPEFLGAVLRPVFPELREEAICVLVLDERRELLIGIIEPGWQLHLQNLVKGRMEPPVAAVHAVIVLRIRLPDLARLRPMEARRVLRGKGEHLPVFRERIVEDGKILIPERRAPPLDDRRNGLRLQQAVFRILQELAEDDRIDAREEVECTELLDGQCPEPMHEIQRLFHLPDDRPECGATRAVHPLRDEIEADRRMALARELLQLAERPLRQHTARGRDEEIEKQP